MSNEPDGGIGIEVHNVVDQVLQLQDTWAEREWQRSTLLMISLLQTLPGHIHSVDAKTDIDRNKTNLPRR